MKQLVIILLIAFHSLTTFGQRYIFYLHGRIIEEQGINAVDTVHGYGAYLYEDILDAFQKSGFKVFSDVRNIHIKPFEYVNKVVNQIDSLIKIGIKPNQITVVGASKGAVLSMFISSSLKNKDVNFVFMAGCNNDIYQQFPDIKFYGNILSIYEKSDDMQSCGKFQKRSTQTISNYKEIELNTGLRHGFLYKPLKEWVEPVIGWANNEYK